MTLSTVHRAAPCLAHELSQVHGNGLAHLCRAVLGKAAFCGVVVCVAWFTLTALRATAHAAQGVYPGFQTIGLWNEDDRIRLDLCLWYPVGRPPSTVQFSEWTLTVNRRAKAMEGRFPLIILSHDSAGNRFAHHELAAILAQSGFVVAAPTHQGDNDQDMQHVFTADQLTNRVRDIRHVIDKLLSTPEVSTMIDANRIGVMGFGTGGTAALLLAGAQVNPDRWAEFQHKAASSSPYLHKWVRHRMDALIVDPALRASMEDRRVRAVSAVAPAYTMLFDKAGLASVRVPSMLVWAEKDRLNAPPYTVQALAESFPVRPRTLALQGNVATGLRAPCPPQREDSSTEALCRGVPLRQLQAATERVNRDGGKFFLDAIGNPNLPPPPPPPPPPAPEPQLAPPPPPPPPAPPVAPPRGSKKKRS